MVEINIGKNQGLTQAVATKLGLTKEECKKIDLSVWQQVVTEINGEQENINQHNKNNPSDPQASIFSGGNDTSTIDKKDTWHKNFITKEGKINLDDKSWDKISELLGKKKPEVKPENKPEETNPDVKPEGKVLKRTVDGEKKQPIIVTKNDKGKKERHELNEDGTKGDSLAATRTIGKNRYISGDFPAQTRVFERTVNGKEKTQIGVYKDENGNKIRKEIITDSKTGKKTLGETLIPVTTFGKNTYVTESEYKKQQEVMSAWKNGTKMDEYSYSETGSIPKIYTNLEQITLKNGQHAWKTDQGTFYPQNNGMVGTKEVPQELIK